MTRSTAKSKSRRTARPINIGFAVTHGFAYYRRALRGIWQYVQARPSWQLTSIAPHRESLQLPRRFQPDGLIVTLNTMGMMKALASWRRPAVNVSDIFSSQPVPRVGVDNVKVGQLAAEHFLERGLRQFAFVGPPRHRFSTERRAAFCEAIERTGHAAIVLSGLPKLEFDPLGHRWDLGPAVYRWLRKLPTPIGIFTPNDLWGVQVVLACHRAGLRVPEDVAVLGVDDDDLYCELTRPRLSSISVPAEQIGFQAVALLERLLKGKQPPQKPLLLPPVGVVARRSSEVLAIDDEDVVAAIRFIREHAHERLRVSDVLAHVPVGRRTLERRCRTALGWGIAEEMRRTHFQRACRLLAGTDLSMEAVALQSGFLGYRHLALVFRKQLGITPTAYRRQMRPSP
jgi:LacI family transcriptional regulator